LYGRFYGIAARRAIERMTPDDGDQLDALAGAVDKARTPAAIERANTAYMSRLVAVAASNRLRSVLRSTSPIVPGNFFVTVQGSLSIQKDGIAAMHAAIAAGDPDAAEQASVDMQAEQAAAVIALLARRAEAKASRSQASR
jgi:DNA-binding GntR family transcriptional regulator